MAERQVHDVDAQLALVGGGELDGRDHVARVAVAIGVEHLQPDEGHLGCHSSKSPFGLAAVAADQPGDVRAVTVIIERGHGFPALREVVERLDLMVEVRQVGNA